CSWPYRHCGSRWPMRSSVRPPRSRIRSARRRRHEADGMRDTVPHEPPHPVRPVAPSGPLTGPSIRALREGQVDGRTRRSLLRAAIGTGIGLWAVEVLGGTLGFAWSALAGVSPTVAVGTLADLEAANPGL